MKEMEELRNHLHNIVREVLANSSKVSCENHTEKLALYFDLSNKIYLCYPCACRLVREVKDTFSKGQGVKKHARKNLNY